jgi:ankyrin repeat protein
MEEEHSTDTHTENVFDLIPNEIAVQIVDLLLLDDDHPEQALKDIANLRLVGKQLAALLQDDHIQKRMYSLIYRYLRSCPTIDQQFLPALVKSGNTTLLNVCLVALLEKDQISPTDVGQALIAAALYQKHDILKLLLKTGSNVNVQDKTGCTALMKAASLRDLTAIELLLSFGADANLRDNHNDTAYDHSRHFQSHRDFNVFGDFSADYNVERYKRLNKIRKLLRDCEFYGNRLGTAVNKIKSNRFVSAIILQQDDPAFDRFVKQVCYSTLIAFLLILFIKQS